MKVLLTGALGNIGFFTLQALLAEGHDVVAFHVLTSTTWMVCLLSLLTKM